MVIQRIQTLYLIIAAILIAVFAFCPSVIFGAEGQQYVLSVLNSGVKDATHPDLLLSALTGLQLVLTIVAIFKFSNLRLQLRLCSINAALSITLLIVIGIIAMVLGDKGNEFTPTYYNVIPLVAFVFYILAYRGISHDKKLLSSSERLR